MRGGIKILFLRGSRQAQTYSLRTDYLSIQFNPGYNTMSFWAGERTTPFCQRVRAVMGLMAAEDN
jgi:hypothetical protein